MTKLVGIAAVAQRSGLTQDTLRWYERQGLLPSVQRGADGRRRYDESTLRIVDLLVRLRRTGMSVRDMRRFVQLVDQGAATHGRRLALLGRHRDQLQAEIAQRQEDLTAIEDKVAHYQQLIEAGLDCGERPVSPEVAEQQRRTA